MLCKEIPYVLGAGSHTLGHRRWIGKMDIRHRENDRLAIAVGFAPKVFRGLILGDKPDVQEKPSAEKTLEHPLKTVYVERQISNVSLPHSRPERGAMVLLTLRKTTRGGAGGVWIRFVDFGIGLC